MTSPRLPLYMRLPEIYRIRDAEQTPPGQLEAYLGAIDEVFGAVRDNIEALYHDQFIETGADWVIPYIADLLGVSHLSGDPWTLRADVARTVRHRRRKGTLGAIESLTWALSGWAVHAVEMRERLAWNQHLNHQRPDEGGTPPLRLVSPISAPVRGGTVNLRDPALLSFVNGPFDPFAHVVDVKPPVGGAHGYNLPNLAIFLWRLEDYTVPVSKPVPPAAPDDIKDLGAVPAGLARFAVRFDLHPLAEPMVLFNRHRFQADDDPPNLTSEDALPGPMPAARLTADTPAGRPDEYVRVALYSAAPPPAPDGVGLTLHLPQAPFAATVWRLRGANLCAWEAGLNPPLREHEIVIDPVHGRVLFGVADKTAEAEPLRDKLLVSATYGFTGPTGAHPVGRPDVAGATVISYHVSPTALQATLANLADSTGPVVIEINDSMTHDLDLSAIAGIGSDAGGFFLALQHKLHIRAASGQRPVIRLKQPLAFRPARFSGPDQTDWANLDVTLEGLYLTANTGPLIRQAALNRLTIDGCTLDPGGQVALDGTRKPMRRAMQLDNDNGLLDPAERLAFDQTPEILIHRSICGALAIDTDYLLTLDGSIVDAGSGIGAAAPALAVHAASGDPETGWGPQLQVSGMTCFGRMRVTRAAGDGGIWLHRLEVHDTLAGCIKFSYFSGNGDRLPQHHACVFGTAVRLGFTDECFGQAGYGQLQLTCNRPILEQGPGADEMGAFGYLRNTHKWKNINIRYREFMPLGVRPVLIPTT